MFSPENISHVVLARRALVDRWAFSCPKQKAARRRPLYLMAVDDNSSEHVTGGYEITVAKSAMADSA
jgi:hypothetical protein